MAMLKEGAITEEGIESLRKRIGENLRLPLNHNKHVTRSVISRYTEGMGEINPLFVEEEYAKTTAFRSLIAPPGLLYTICLTYVQMGLRGVHGFHSGSDWELYKPVYVEDTVNPECRLVDVQEKQSEFAGRMVMLYFETKYYRHDGDLVAKARSWSVRAERGKSRDKGKYSSIELPHPWKEEEIQRIEDDILNEQVRGREVRYWEDVVVGEELPPAIRGPLCMVDIIGFCMAGGFPGRIAGYPSVLPFYRRHPDWAHRNPATGALEPAFMVHFDIAAAKSIGLPYPYDVGTQRNMYLMNMLTNWMGDDGWLKSVYAEYRRFFYFSDVIWVKGRVVDKFVDENGEYAVKIETSAFNQRQENTMPGRAVVLLPSRTGYHPLNTRLRE